MSINYLCVPVDDSILDYAWNSNYELPGNPRHGRWPTLAELRQCLTSIPDHEVTGGGNEQSFSITAESTKRVPMEGGLKTANTDAPETYLNVHGYLEGKPRPLIVLHGDYELVVTIVQRLTEYCGPQCFFADCEGVPYFVIDGLNEPIGPNEET